jgi:hypothetical protein
MIDSCDPISMSPSGHKAYQRQLVTKSALIPIEGLREVAGGGEWEPNQILLQETAYVLSSNPKSKTLEECDEHTNQ